MSDETIASQGPTGACGVSCWVCRAYLGGVCRCTAGDSPDAQVVIAIQEKRWGNACPIFSCAVRRKVSYCGRDCPDFPCGLLESSGSPFSGSYIAMVKRRIGEADIQ